MRKQEVIEHHDCPAYISEALRTAGGENRFGEPNFRVIWGYNRIVPVHGEWQDFEQCLVTLRDKATGYAESRPATRLARSVIETRHVPKYLPGNCWHLEMWRPPEDYGPREDWGKLGQEVIGSSTVDTSGPYPERGEYELCYALTSDGTSRGTPIMLIEGVVTDIARMIIVGRDRFSFQQRRSAIEQEQRRKEDGWSRATEDILREGMKPYAGEEFVTVPQIQVEETGS